jgi:hypothetical protein
MNQAGLEDRYQILLRRISRKRGDTLVRTLRYHHGLNFLPQYLETDDLKGVLYFANEASLSQLERHYPA